MGSVKEVAITKKPSPGSFGEGSFTFSDRYSVFDWGEMPDHIPMKGAALCVLSSYFFHVLEKRGIKSHFAGLEEKNGAVRKYEELSSYSNKMHVRVVRVLKPSYNKEKNSFDYSIYTNESANYLIPLEVIYRNSLPEGSSVFKRLKNGSVTYLQLGLKKEPVPGDRLGSPILDVSTKLEHLDRYLSWEEAEKISNLGQKINRLKEMTLEISSVITSECAKTGIENVDGKFEFALSPSGEIILVDVLGTPDECRFVRDGFHISKEFARRWYRGTKWYEEVEKAKKERGDDWKSFVTAKPEPLLPEVKTLISQMYLSVTNEITGRKFFDSPPLKEIISKLKGFDKKG